MPEFHLDTRGTVYIKGALGEPAPGFETAYTWRILDAFTQGYIEAMFFTNASDPDDGDLQNATFKDLAPEALARIVKDCTAFQTDNRADLDEATDNGRINGYDDTSAGRDFWYTRCGHGVGFWDRDLGDVGDTLAKACEPWGSVDVYLGDDKLIYLEGGKRP